MPRGNQNNNRRARGGNRGRANGRGRGAPHRGVPTVAVTPTMAATAAGRQPRHPYPHTNAEIDAVIQQWPATLPDVNGVGNTNRRGGPWRGGAPNSRSGAGMPSMRGIANSPRGGASTPRGRGTRGRGRGRGRGSYDGSEPYAAPRRPHFGAGVQASRPKTVIGKDAPLSDLLYSERPLLRPVKFVRATLTPFLFQHSEDVLKPAAEIAAASEGSHVPTADRVARLFKGSAAGAVSESDSDSEANSQDALEEIDFADLAQLRAEVDNIAQSTAAAAMTQVIHRDEVMEEVDFTDLAAMRAKVDAAEPRATLKEGNNVQEVFTGLYNAIEDKTQKPSTADDLLSLKPSTDISSPFHHNESFTFNRDAIMVEEDVPAERPSYAAVETDLVTSTVDDTSLRPDTAPPDDPNPLFVVDTTPARPAPFTWRSASDLILVDRIGHGETLGDQDEERIVYVAPHPRSKHTSPTEAVPVVKLPQTSRLIGKSIEVSDGLRSPVREVNASSTTASDRDGACEVLEEDQYLSLAALTLEPVAPESTVELTGASHTNVVPRARKKEAQRQRRGQRQSKRARSGFGAYGAAVSEARLREEDLREKQRPRWETRRRGDSDVDWGTENEGGDEGRGRAEADDEADAVSDDLGGMHIDSDLDMDMDAVMGFLKSLSAEGSKFVTMDDIENEAWMRREDEEGQGGPDRSSASESSDEGDEEEEEEEEAFELEEEILIAESEGGEELSEGSDDSDDDKLSPISGFQARLRKIRERGRGQQPRSVQGIPDDNDDDDNDDEEDTPDFLPWTRSADDEEFIAHINDLIEENSQILSGHDRKQKKALFRDLHEGHVNASAFMDDPEFTTPISEKKDKKGKDKQGQATGYFGADLAAQWAKDRAKKAERKRERETARLLAALDPLSAPPPGGGRTSRKAKRTAAAREAVVDTATLEAQMRRFVADGRPSVSLPPMSKATRKQMHEMAALFGVKSVSKGKGAARYTTLVRTSRTGVGVKEAKVQALTRRYGGAAGGKGRGGWMPRHKEGDEVGKEAPKIGQNNIGFKMLASMGWSEGDRIGGSASVGIEVPLTAIIKNSKLGLGATR